MDEPLPKFLVLVPSCFNDGRQVPKEVILEFQEKLFLLGGGFTEAGTVKGAYRMADGKKQIDHSYQYWICVPEDQSSALKQIVGELGAELGQESMYFERTGGTVELLPPSFRGGELK